MYKAIVFVRTSTDRQEMDSQQRETINFAKKDGYSNDEIKVIGTNGASAIKLDKLYLNDIQEIYDTCKEYPIEAIYGYDIDRLGRNELVLVTLKQFCIDNKINLKIYVSNLSLLNEDKTANDGINIMFSVLAAQAASEMRTKKARFERARKRNYETGKYMGGYIPYGYCVNENGYYEIKEEEGEMVKLIYQLFNTGEFSSNSLAKELNERGYLNGVGNLFNAQYIRLILKSELYTGEYTDEKGRIIKFPPLVSVEEQNKAKSILLKNNTTQNKAQTHYFFGNKLIVCPVCGHHYLRKSGVYTCAGLQLSRREGQAHIADCDYNLTIAVNCMDGILWDITKKELIKDIESNNKEKEREAREKIKVVNQKIKTLSTKLQKYADKIEEIILKSDALMLSEALIAKRVAVVQEQQKEDEKTMVSLQEEKARYESVIEKRDNLKAYINYQTITDIELKGDEKVISDFVHQYVHQVSIEKTEYNGSSKFLLIYIEMKNGVKYKVWFNGRQKKGARAFIWCSEDNTEGEYTFANIEREDDKVTSKSIELLKQLNFYCITYLSNHSFSELWEVLTDSNNEINKLFNQCQEYNHQQVVQMINQLSIKKD